MQLWEPCQNFSAEKPKLFCSEWEKLRRSFCSVKEIREKLLWTRRMQSLRTAETIWTKDRRICAQNSRKLWKKSFFFTEIIFSLKAHAGHLECNFENHVEKFPLRVQEFFNQSPKVTTKNYIFFENKYIFPRNVSLDAYETRFMNMHKKISPEIEKFSHRSEDINKKKKNWLLKKVHL